MANGEPSIKTFNEQEESNELHPNLKFYGYAILISTWLLFVVTINSFLQLWQFIISPIAGTPLYNHLTTIFHTIDDLVVKLWCIYVVCWWWAFISWTGLKLFRHSKGIQNWCKRKNVGRRDIAIKTWLTLGAVLITVLLKDWNPKEDTYTPWSNWQVNYHEFFLLLEMVDAK